MTDQEKTDQDIQRLKSAQVGDVIRLYKDVPPNGLIFEWPVWVAHGFEYHLFERVSDQGWKRTK